MFGSAHNRAADVPVAVMQMESIVFCLESKIKSGFEPTQKFTQRHETKYGRKSCIVLCSPENYEVKPGLCEIQQVWEAMKWYS